MDQDIFDKFFKPYAKTVDQVDQVSAFWRLSDTIISEIIKNDIAPYCDDSSVVLDAGGGTGRWAIKMKEYVSGKIIVFDRSKDMLTKANENLAGHASAGDIVLINGDLTDMNGIADDSVDHIVSIYSPLSFVYEQERALTELYRILKPGGRILIMSHGYHNALFSKINNYRASIDELNKLEDECRVSWAPHVPELVTQSKETFEKLLLNCRFVPIKTYGIPVFVQPGKEDFDAENKEVSSVSKYLNDPLVFKRIFDLEMRHNSEPTVCNRGMNIFALAQKSK